jgi:hypothetical protein
MEIGIHCLKAVPLGKPGRGRGEKTVTQVIVFLDKPQHLGPCVRWLAELCRGWQEKKRQPGLTFF